MKLQPPPRAVPLATLPKQAPAISAAIGDPAVRAILYTPAFASPFAPQALPPMPKSVEKMANLGLGQLGLAPKSLAFLPSLNHLPTTQNDVMMRQGLVAMEKELQTRLGPQGWAGVSLVIGLPKQVKTIMDGQKSTYERSLAGMKVVNACAKVAASFWPQFANAQYALDIAVKVGEVGEVVLIAVNDFSDKPQPA